MVFPWVTRPDPLTFTFADGVYGLRVIGYDEAGGVLSNRRELPVCDTTTTAEIIVRLDNQSTFPEPGPPGNPCGSNTTHNCTNEPNTDIVDARIVHLVGPPTDIGPCGDINLVAGDVLEVDFIAHDAQGHLASYSLIATFGENLAQDLDRARRDALARGRWSAWGAAGCTGGTDLHGRAGCAGGRGSDMGRRRHSPVD